MSGFIMIYFCYLLSFNVPKIWSLLHSAMSVSLNHQMCRMLLDSFSLLLFRASHRALGRMLCEKHSQCPEKNEEASDR